METTGIAYKSLRLIDGKIVSDYDHSEWIIGVWRTNPYPVVEACKGLNCCEFIIDTMKYVSGEIIAQVEYKGKTIIRPDKITAQDMRIIKSWKWNAFITTSIAYYAASLVEDNYTNMFPTDYRLKSCNKTISRYISDPSPVSTAELFSAWETTCSVVRESDPVWEEATDHVANSARWAARSTLWAMKAAKLSANIPVWWATGSTDQPELSFHIQPMVSAVNSSIVSAEWASPLSERAAGQGIKLKIQTRLESYLENYCETIDE